MAVDLNEFGFGQIIGPIFHRPTDNLLAPLPGEEFHYLAGRQQIFARNYVHPRNLKSASDIKKNEVNRMYFAHATGTGKTSKSLHIARQYLQIPGISVIILGFDNTKEVFINEAMKFPEHGYISHSDYTRYLELRARYDQTKSAVDLQEFRAFHQRLRSKITGRSRGSKIEFFGYQEFANRVGFKDDTTTMETVVVNNVFVESMRGCLIIADEIRNAYNTEGLNTRGLALKYVSDKLGNDIHVVLMSATPMYNTVQESVDLAQFLNFGMLKRTDYFRDETLIDESKFIALFRNRVSVFALREEYLYPAKKFPPEAGSLGPIDPNEFRFIKCPMTDLQIRALMRINTLQKGAELADEPDGFNSSTYFLRDFALPKPDAPGPIEEPLLTVGDMNAYYPNGVLPPNLISPDGLQRYFPKHAALMKYLRHARGKTLIFHQRVQWGVKLIEQIMEAHNYIQGDTTPNSGTPCVFCPLTAAEHGKKNAGDNLSGARGVSDSLSGARGVSPLPHIFTPSKFSLMHSDIDKSRLSQNRAEYNSISNLNGERVQHIIASKLVVDGYDFNAIRTMFILAFTDTYHMMLQLLGRSIRRRSHLALPPNERDVTIYIFVNVVGNEMPNLNGREVLEAVLGTGFTVTHTAARDIEQNPDNWTPERYIIKWPTYVAINKVMDLFGSIAVDRNIYENKQSTVPTDKHRYYTRNLFGDEIANINRVVKRLFLWRSMWKFEDLVEAVRMPPVSVNVDVSKSSIETIKYVINNIIYYPSDKAYLFGVERFVQSNTRAATLFNFENNGKFFINRNNVQVVVVVGELLMLRSVEVLSHRISVHPITPVTHLRFRINLMADEVTKLMSEKSPTPALFKEYSAEVHEDAVRSLIVEGVSTSILLKMYIKLGIIRQSSDRSTLEYWKNNIGYRRVGDSWISFAVTRPPYASIVGYYENMQFKILDVRTSAHGTKKEDAREYGRGVACINKPPSELKDIAKALGAEVAKSITTIGLCLALEKRLLDLQMSDGSKSTYFVYWGAP